MDEIGGGFVLRVVEMSMAICHVPIDVVDVDVEDTGVGEYGVRES